MYKKEEKIKLNHNKNIFWYIQMINRLQPEIKKNKNNQVLSFVQTCTRPGERRYKQRMTKISKNFKKNI